MTDETTPIRSKEEREELKNEAVNTREKGDSVKALTMLELITQWDKANENHRGYVDAKGHMRICYTRLADAEKDKEQATELRMKAVETAEDALSYAKACDAFDEGGFAIQIIHLTSARFDLAMNSENSAKKEQLELALQDIDEAIRTLPGSEAHKAWPINTKGKILAELGRLDEAIEVLIDGEKLLSKGYKEEIAKDDQAEMKIKVWWSGLLITRAGIYMQQNKTILTQNMLFTVLQLAKEETALTERAKEAQRMLETLNTNKLSAKHNSKKLYFL